MASLQLELQNLHQESTFLKSRLDQIHVNSAVIHSQAEALEVRTATYENANEINLEIFEALSQFDGTQNNYRLWRKDATRHNRPHQGDFPQKNNQHFRRPLYYQKQQNNFPKPEPMDTSSRNTRNFNNSNNTRQQYNSQRFHSQPWKRIREQSGNFQQAHKTQRQNQIKTQQDDNISITTEKSSKRIETKPLRMITIHGESILNFKQEIKLFNKKLEFFELKNDYDLMLGVEGLT